MDDASKARLKNLCTIFNIPMSACEQDPATALVLLTHLYAMPFIKDHGQRHNYGNQILGNTRGHFDEYSEFVGRLGAHVAMMQELPNWYNNLNQSTDELVEKYLDIEREVYWLNKAGFGAGASAGAAGFAEWIKTGSVKEGIKKTAERAIGRGAILEAIEGRIAARAATAAPIIGAVVIVGGTIAYASGIQQMEEIRAILMDRYQNGKMTDEQFRRVFGTQIDPTLVKKYWEM